MTANIKFTIITLLVGSCLLPALHAQEVPDMDQAVYPMAIFPFEERGRAVESYGNKVSDILFASLVADNSLWLVERAEIEKVMSEAELNLSGMVSASQQTKVGEMIGAEVLLLGSVIQADTSLYIVAKIIGTETSRVLGESVKGKMNDDLGTLVEELAEKVATKIKHEGHKLVAQEVSREDRVASIADALGERERPAVMISIGEHHVGRATIDPAAETEFTYLCTKTGFDVIDADEGSKKDADILITGEGFSEFAMRRGNLVSVKARLEVKAVDPISGKLIGSDRQTVVEVDVTEQVAGKTALQQAAGMIAERLLPQLAE